MVPALGSNPHVLGPPRPTRSAALETAATSRRWWPWADSNRHWTGSRPAASARLGYMAIGPSGGLEPPLHGLRARRAALTPQREWISLERMTGLEPVPQGLEGPQAAVTPHSHCTLRPKWA